MNSFNHNAALLLIKAGADFIGKNRHKEDECAYILDERFSKGFDRKRFTDLIEERIEYDLNNLKSTKIHLKKRKDRCKKYRENKGLYQQIFTDVRRENIEGIKKYIKNGSDLDIINENMDSLLHLATYSNNLEIAKLLVEAGANVNVRNGVGRTPITTIIGRRYTPKEVPLLRYLTKNGGGDTMRKDLEKAIW